MIYIFDGCKAICKAPCTICQGACKACGEACKCWSEFWEPIYQNPLGTYVMGTGVAMILAAAGAGWGLTNLNDCDDDTKGKLALFCIADIALAVLHAGMAYYMQRQIIKGLGDKDFKSMTAKEIQEQAGHILLYDVPVCLYTFVSWAAFGLNCWALSIPACGEIQPQIGAAFLMIAWGVCAGMYLFCWYCCKCGQAAGGAVKDKAKGTKGQIVGVTEGA